MATNSSTNTPSKTMISEETRAAVLQQKDAAQHCLVCYSDLTAFHTLTPCHHDEICPTCHLRLRKLHSDTACTICKQDHEQLIVVATSSSTAAPQQQFEDYNIWGNSLGSDFIYREDVGMFFPVEYYQREIQPLFGYHCTVPNCNYTGLQTTGASTDATTTSDNSATQQTQQNDHNGILNANHNDDDQLFAKGTTTNAANNPLRALQDHLRTKHRMTLCNLCVEHKRDFVSKLPRFTPNKLKQHLTTGDGPGTGFEGHPLCEFCRPKRFYDITALHLHLQKEHYKCHVCEQHAGLLNQYFNNYKSLERHFDRQHFLCHDVQCLQARFVVFGNELDLRHHERSVHGGTSTGDSKIQLSFRYARRGNDQQQQQQNVPTEDDFNYGLDGEAFVPAAMPTQQQRDAVPLHPLHVQRTAELREQAAAIRAEQERGVDAFPTLAEAVAADAANSEQQQQDPTRLRVGWASGSTLQRLSKKPAGVVTEEDFPSLPGASKKKGTATGASAKLKAPPQRQMAAMMQQAGGGWSTNTAATMAAGTLPTRTNDNASTFITPSVASAPRSYQQQNNLSADNFTALGPATQGGPHTYAAAEAFAASRRQPNKNAKGSSPSFTDADFPPPPASASANTMAVRHRMLGSNAQPHAATSNILAAPNSSFSMSSNKPVTVQDMKATLGQVKYKQLKEYTKQFVANELAPDAYVDHAAALFDKGYGDVDFWNFLPSLISSCPSAGIAKHQAMEYMESLRKSRIGAMNHEETTVRHSATGASAATIPAPVAGQWSSVQSSRVTAAPPVTVAPPQRVVTPPVAYNTTTSIATLQRNSKTKNAWGNGGSSSRGGGGTNIVQMVQAAPGTVGAAAAKQTARVGTATKFMASQQQQQQQSKSTSNKKKSKQSKELQDLAFGKK